MYKITIIIVSKLLISLHAWSAPTSNSDSPINEIEGVIVRGPIYRKRKPIVPVTPMIT